MSTPNPPRPLALRIALFLFWAALCVLALYGLVFLGLLIYGEVQFSLHDCGPRNNWTQENYSTCSDIDETGPIFFRIGLPAVLPLLGALLIRAIRRQILRNRAYLSQYRYAGSPNSGYSGGLHDRH